MTKYGNTEVFLKWNLKWNKKIFERKDENEVKEFESCYSNNGSSTSDFCATNGNKILVKEAKNRVENKWTLTSQSLRQPP